MIVPCGININLKEEERAALYRECEKYRSLLANAGVRVRADVRDNYSPGWKFNHWELKGVPIRLEVGPKDLVAGQYVAVRRDTGEKVVMRSCGLTDDIPALLDTIQSSMFARARTELADHLVVTDSWDTFVESLDRKCLIQAPFCGAVDCEEKIKEESKSREVEEGAPSMGAKSLCIPFNQPGQIEPGTKCVKQGCNSKPQYYTMFGRSY